MDTETTSRLGVIQFADAATRAGLIARELPTTDEGIDAQLELKTPEGRGTGRLIAVQIKAGDSAFKEEIGDAFVYRPIKRHRDYWINHSLPVLIVLCNVKTHECYWQHVTPETCRSTGKGYRIDVPKNQRLASTEPFEAIAAPVAATSEFVIAKTHDVSHALARRLSLDIVVQPTGKGMSKERLAAIIRAAVQLGRDSDYARDAISAAAHRGRPAHMVSGFVYLRDADRPAAQWICRFQWTSDDTPQEARYLGVQGEVDSDGLLIEWQFDRELPALLDGLRMGKGAYLAKVDAVLSRARPMIEALGAFHRDNCPPDQTTQISEMGAAFEAAWDDHLAPPHECQRLDDAMAELVAILGNLRFIWGAQSKYTRDNARALSVRAEMELARIWADIEFLRRDAR